MFVRDGPWGIPLREWGIRNRTEAGMGHGTSAIL